MFGTISKVAKEHPVLFATAFCLSILFYKIILFIAFWMAMWMAVWYIVEAAVNADTKKSTNKKQWAVDPDYTIETVPV